MHLSHFNKKPIKNGICFYLCILCMLTQDPWNFAKKGGKNNNLGKVRA